jgi:hypothetical protein
MVVGHFQDANKKWFRNMVLQLNSDAEDPGLKAAVLTGMPPLPLSPSTMMVPYSTRRLMRVLWRNSLLTSSNPGFNDGWWRSEEGWMFRESAIRIMYYNRNNVHGYAMLHIFDFLMKNQYMKKK